MSDMRLVVFDCDGTLVDSQFMITESMRRAFVAHGLEPMPHEAIRRVVGLRLEHAIAELVPEKSATEHSAIADAYRETFFELHNDPVLQEPLYPDALEVVTDLHAQGYILGIATGKSRRGLDRILSNHKLSPFFSSIKTADDGPGKPNPQILLDIMKENDVNPKETAVVGDTTFDIQLARNAKAYALGVEWGYHEPEELLAAGAFKVIYSFKELPEVLTELWSPLKV